MQKFLEKMQIFCEKICEKNNAQIWKINTN